MGYGSTINRQVEKVIRETTKSWLIVLDDLYEYWIPKSQCNLYGNLIEMPSWLESKLEPIKKHVIEEEIKEEPEVEYEEIEHEGEYCDWEQESYGSQKFDTLCGGAVYILHGTIKSNHFNYCSYCGKPINEIKKGK